MTNKNYNSDLGIASIESDTSNIKVLTLLQQAGTKRPSVSAYLGARYSRSSESVSTIAEEVSTGSGDAAQRLAKIFHGYGHASVADMCPLTVCLENVPMVTAMRFFYLNPVIVGGQERSSRYQDFGNGSWRDLSLINSSQFDQHAFSGLNYDYRRIMQFQLTSYKHLLERTTPVLADYFQIDENNKKEVAALTSRSFDVARHLLPMGLNTSLVGIMSARMWSEYISYLMASTQKVENELGALIKSLLIGEGFVGTDYVPEADNLIKYTEANYTREETAKKLVSLFKNLEKFNGARSSEGTVVSHNPHAITSLLSKIALLVDPRSTTDYHYSADDFNKIVEILLKTHNHHKQIGTLGQSGAIVLNGSTDLGSLKDLNRHRSLERFIPLLENQIDIQAELDYKEPYRLCEYLHLDYPAIKELKEMYDTSFKTTYTYIRNWHASAVELIGKDAATEYTRYLLPHAHNTAYEFYGSVDDLLYTISLRIRPGGHINYRSIAYDWLATLAADSPLWKPLLQKLSKPDAGSTLEFIDRS